MSALGRSMVKPVLMAGGLGFLLLLAVALIWLHLSPETVAALTLGSIGLLIMAMRPLVAVHVFIMLLNIENLVQSQEGVTVMKAVGGIILAGWLLSMAARRRPVLRLNVFMVAMFLFVLWCGVSLFYASDGDAALVRVLTFVQLTGATVMFSSVVDTTPKVRGVYWAIVLWTLLSTIVAIVEYYLGMTHVAVGLAGNRNLLATYIGAATVCTYLLLQTTTRALPRLVLAAALPVFFLGLALTFSRSGLIALTVALAAVWYRVARERGFVVLTVTAVAVCAITLLLPESFWRRAGSIVPAIQKQEDTFGVRVKLWKVGLRMIDDHPIIGVGPGNFTSVFHRYARGELAQPLNAHNTYITVAAETGLVGLALYLAILVLALYEASRASRVGKVTGSRDLESFAVAVEVTILLLMIGCITGDGQTSKLLWFLFGLGLALRRMADAKVGAYSRQATASLPAAAPATG